MANTNEVVRTGAGFHGRIRAGGNHEPLWTTEVLHDRAQVVRAFELLSESFGLTAAATAHALDLVDVDER